MPKGKSEFTIQCGAAGLNPQTVRMRMKKGMTLKEALSMPVLGRLGTPIGYDPNVGMVVQAEAAWRTTLECLKRLDSQLKLRDRIIARIKDDPEGRKAYERAMKKIVEASDGRP